MKNPSIAILFGLILSGLWACKSTQFAGSDGEVRYTVIVTNSAHKPVDSAKVDLRTESDASYSHYTDHQGRTEFLVESTTNQFSVSKKGFWSVDSIDEVTLDSDSTDAEKVTLKIVRITLIATDESYSSSTHVSSSAISSSQVSSSSSVVSSSSTKSLSGERSRLDP